MFRSKSAFLRGAFIALALGAAPVLVESALASTIEAQAVPLDPGDYVWQPERSTSGAVEVVVSLSEKIAYVFRGGTLIGVTTVSTGKPGHDTPTGTFPILQKNRDHRSNLYNDSPMPFMQRLTWDGIALHGGEIPGHPASHGCVRLPLAFARHLFAVTELGATVRIVDEPVSILPGGAELASAD
jgi:lipoprotein-anchoring transpeptidase ErfK/SrfK